MEKAFNSYGSFIRVFENSELLIFDSNFENIFGRAKGSVVCGDYQNTNTEIFNTKFNFNAAYEGGIFCSKDNSKISCENCEIKNNFAVIGGVFATDTNGQMEFKNCTIKDNIAYSVGLGQVIDSVGLVNIEKTNFSNNQLLPLNELESKGENGHPLNYIPDIYWEDFIS